LTPWILESLFVSNSFGDDPKKGCPRVKVEVLKGNLD